MILIAHRGNITGPNKNLENLPSYIETALDQGFFAEVDVWGIDENLWLGHDGPQYMVPVSFFQKHRDRLYCHCKNRSAITSLVSNVYKPTLFFHDTDAYTFTSDGVVWCYPGNIPPHQNSIIVLPEQFYTPDDLNRAVKIFPACVGICSDYVKYLKYK